MEERVAKEGPSIASKVQPEDALEEDYLMDNIVGTEEDGSDVECCAYVTEYEDIINIMSRLCSVISHNSKTENKDKKVKVE